VKHKNVSVCICLIFSLCVCVCVCVCVWERERERESEWLERLAGMRMPWYSWWTSLDSCGSIFFIFIPVSSHC
jgi:hypothetical protein